jgi:tripartite-type tricarboxylate transporter receptor subunit TctC
MRLMKLAAAVAATLLAGVMPTLAQQYPQRPITIIVPFAAGGPTDVLARVLGQQMSQTLGQSVVVADVTGAGGTLGSAKAAKAAPDGYTLVMGNIGTHAASVGLYKNLSYDPRTDFEPIMLVATTPMVLVTRKDLPVATLNDVIALAKQRKITQGNAGTGSASHLTTLLYVSLTHADLQPLTWTALFAPKGTPKPIVDRLNVAIDQAMKDPTVAKRLAELGADVPPPGEERSPQALAKLVASEVAKWVPLIRAVNIAE